MTDLRDLNVFDPTDRSGIPEAVRNQMRYRALHETYYLARNILGYSAMVPRVHGPICTFLDTCRQTRRLVQDPRSHFKTTVKTISHNIRLQLNNPTWRFLLVGDTDTNAEKHLFKIRRHYEANALLRWLFPERVWEDPYAQAPKWAKNELVLPSTAVHGEATFDAIGAGSAVVSRHYDMISVDDLIADDEYYSETEMARAIEWATGLESLFATDTPIETKLMDIVGTHWRTNDVYAHFEKYFGREGEKVITGPHSYRTGALAVFRRSAEDENGDPIFPEAISKEFLTRLKERNPERYAAQYANNPYDSATAYFKLEYLKYYHWALEGLVLAVRHPDNTFERIPISNLEIMSFCDPHAGGPKSISRFRQGGRAAVITTGVHSATGRIFMLDCWIKRAPTDKVISEIIRQSEQWLPQRFFVEANGLQKMLKPWLDERVARESRPDVPYYPFIPKGDKDGERRIRGLQPLFRAGQIHILESFTDFVDEYRAWPNGTKDGLDALSQGLNQWGVGFDDVTDQMMTDYENKLRAMRSIATGY